eukprot:jgi/Chrzof1/5639/Cz16g09260.t1
MSDVPLSAAYSTAVDLSEKLKAGDATFQAAAVDALDQCESRIDNAGIFSSNEDKDDIHTGNLRYLLVPYLRGDVLSHARAPDAASRMRQVTDAIESYNRFLHRCYQYQLLPESAETSYVGSEEGRQQDPSSRRATKIERFKRNKALDSLLQHLQRQKNMAAHDDDSQTTAPVGGVGGWDEEDERQLWLLKTESAILAALDQREVLQQELELVQHAQQRQSSQPSTAGSAATMDASDQDETPDEVKQQMMGKLAGIAGQLAGNQRQQAKQQVFRPSHILPTMSIEQQAYIEMQVAMERQRREEKAAQRRQDQQDRDNADGEEEEALRKQRAWDEFKDDNPAGWGNSKLRPTA